MDSQDYLEICVSVPGEEFGDIVAAEAGELGFDAFMFEQSQEGPQGIQKCYIQSELFDEALFSSLMERLGEMTGLDLQWTSSLMPKVNWNQEWENSGFTPIECGSYVVAPLSADIPEGFEPVWLNPQMAFGTGHHHTTFMVMQTMQELRGAICGASVMDLGCGTAVLAILAAKLGASKIYGIDIDAVAARSAEDNVRLNGFDFPIICGDASSLEKDAYDFLLANIHRNIIIADLPSYAEAVRKGGKLILSGFYEEDVPDIKEAANACGFKFCSGRSREGWCCLVLERI